MANNTKKKSLAAGEKKASLAAGIKVSTTSENKIRKNVTLSEETLAHLEQLRQSERRNSISNMIEGLVDRAWTSATDKKEVAA